MAGRKGKLLTKQKVKQSLATASLYSPARSKTTECGNEVSQLETIFRDMMLCPLCGQEYRDGERLPKSLPCTHTCCALCLSGRLCETVVECPECGARYDIGGDVDSLPDCAMVMRLMGTVCKLCNAMAKLEECAHCRLVSCATCLVGHLADVRDELAAAVREIASSAELLSAKMNLVDAALVDVDEKAQRVRAEAKSEADSLAELVALKHDRVMDQIEKEVAKERRRLGAVKKALADAQDASLGLCAGLTEELEKSLSVLPGRFSSIKNTCAVQLDKIQREHAAVLALDWQLVLQKPNHDRIKKELEELRVSIVDKAPKQSASSAAKLSPIPSPLMAHEADELNPGKDQRSSDHNASFIRIDVPGKSHANMKVFL